MLIEDLDAGLINRADVIVFDVSNPGTKMRKAVMMRRALILGTVRSTRDPKAKRGHGL